MLHQLALGLPVDVPLMQRIAAEGALVGATDVLPLPFVNRGLSRMLAPGDRRFFSTLMQASGTEGAQSGLARALQNAIAQQYDDTISVWDGVLDEGALGFALGGVFHGAIEGVRDRIGRRGGPRAAATDAVDDVHGDEVDASARVEIAPPPTPLSSAVATTAAAAQPSPIPVAGAPRATVGALSGRAGGLPLLPQEGDVASYAQLNRHARP